MVSWGGRGFVRPLPFLSSASHMKASFHLTVDKRAFLNYHFVMTNEEAIRIIRDYDKKHDCHVDDICFCNPDFPEGVKACSDINIQTAYNCLRMSINERFEKQATKKNIRQMK